MRTENGRKVKYFIGDHSASELENYLEATFPSGKLQQEEVDDLCLLMGQLEEMMYTAEGVYQQRSKQHEEQLEEFVEKVRRDARRLKILQRVLQVIALVIFVLVLLWSKSWLGCLIWSLCALVIITVFNHVIDLDSIYQNRMKMLSDEGLLLSAYNERCVKEKRSLDIIPERPADIDKWREQMDALWAFVKKRNPYDEEVGI